MELLVKKYPVRADNKKVVELKVAHELPLFVIVCKVLTFSSVL